MNNYLTPFFYTDITLEIEIKPLKGKNVKVNLDRPIDCRNNVYFWQPQSPIVACTIVARRIKNSKGRTIDINRTRIAVSVNDVINLLYYPKEKP